MIYQSRAGCMVSCDERDAATYYYANGFKRDFAAKVPLGPLPRALRSSNNRSGRKPCFFLDVPVRDEALRQL
jgi:hypothetical protein